ncbi:MAG: metallophosphoesterase [Bacteroidetes bacterium]|nr:metallophosphoesterase [Bacteroidota bacterium]
MKNRISILLLIIFHLSFLTFNLFAQEFSFAAMSDSRGKYNGVNEPILSALTEHLITNQTEVDFLFFMGDLVDGSDIYPDSTLAELKYWKKVMSSVYNNSNMVWPYIWPVIGNHEAQHPKDAINLRLLFNDVFMNGPEDEMGLTYSFDYKNVHFVCINSERWYYGDPEDTTDDRRDWHYVKNLDWLINDLEKARARNVNFIFVFSHDVPFPIGGHLHDGLPNLGEDFILPIDSTKQWYVDQRDKFWQILVDFKVSAYLCGHEHIYGRQAIGGVYQIVAGSSGAPLYEFNPTYNAQPDSIMPYGEMSYNDAVPYYKVLKYNYGPGKNSQHSKDFFGLRAFQYVTFHVKEDLIHVQTFGAYPRENTDDEMEGEIGLIDEFIIDK